MKLSEMVKAAAESCKDDIILVKINGKLAEISDAEITDEKIEYISTATPIGNDVYKRSVVLLMLNAIDKVDKDKQIDNVCVDCSISKGLYCRIEGNLKLTQEFLDQVKEQMIRDVKADLPIVKRNMKTAQAVKMFKERGMIDKTRLLKYRRSSEVNVYSIENYSDYFYGYMAYSTGILGVFDLIQYDDGFVLQLPVRSQPKVVPEFVPQQKLFHVLKETMQWADMLNLNTVGALNEHIISGQINSLILVQEALQEQKIVEIVNQIKERGGVKFVMIAGPSSSGKTTFSHRLSIQLEANGLRPHAIGVDNYFVEREETPLDENGKYNFEDLHAIDIGLFNRHMSELLAGRKVEIPDFNFVTGKKEYNGNCLQLGTDDILVIEGIHCLNDELSYSLPLESKFKIYISALTQLNVDEHNRVSTTDGRLIRRLARDFRTRGASAKRTLSMWESVRKGEEKNIFPFQEQADVMFNSAMAYELCVLKPLVEPLLFTISEDEPEYQEARRIMKFLDYFLPCGTDYVPIDSILREFVGGGCFRI